MDSITYAKFALEFWEEVMTAVVMVMRETTDKNELAELQEQMNAAADEAWKYRDWLDYWVGGYHPSF